MATPYRSAPDPRADPSLISEPGGRVDPRGTKVFPGLGRILAFFALFLLSAYLLDAIISGGLRRVSTSKFGSLNNVVSGRVNAEIVINGSSRALTHYDPRVIEAITGRSAYNLGMNGTQTDVHAAVLKTYITRNSKPKIVIQNLESFTFEPTESGELYDPGLYLPYLNEEPLYQTLSAIDKNVWKWKHIPLYGYAVEDLRFTWVWGVLAWFGVNGPDGYIKGFSPRHSEWTGDFESFRASLGERGVTYRIEDRGVRALTDLIKVCKDSDIELILVYSPVYYEMQKLERNRTEVFAEFAKLCDQFQVPLWDYSDSPISRQRDNFYNSQHLNARGAATFSQDLAERLRKHLNPPAGARAPSLTR